MSVGIDFLIRGSWPGSMTRSMGSRAGPLGLIVIAQSLTMPIAPLLGLLIVAMANKTAVMGDLRNKWRQNVFAVVGLGATISSSIRLITILIG